jgi:surface protein
VADLNDLNAKRLELNTAIENHTAAVVSGVQVDIDATRAAAQAKGDEYAKLISQVKQDDPAVTNDDQLFSNPGRMNALVRGDIATIVTTGKMFGQGMKLLVDTEATTVGATNVILSFETGSDITIDWGDNSGYQSYTGAASHTYSAPGQYTVEVHGMINGFTRSLIANRKQIKDVMQWGVATFASTESMFRDRTGFVISASDEPTFLPGASCISMFQAAGDFNSNINHWDVSNVVDMTSMFAQATVFNQPLNSWDVSGVTKTEQMFIYASTFNQALNTWNVSNVVDARHMFSHALSFNGSVNDWNLSSCLNTSNMFYNASAFNRHLNTWNVSAVTDMSRMFLGASVFNGSLAGWNTGNVTTMREMFNTAISFIQSIDHFNVSKVTDMVRMFRGASAFNGTLNTWNTINVTSMDSMFFDAITFNRPLNNWNVSNVTDMSSMFRSAGAFNQPLNAWNTSSVTDMATMFFSASTFGQNISMWNVDNVVTASAFSGGSNLTVNQRPSNAQLGIL